MPGAVDRHEALRRSIQGVTSKPGVYRMLDDAGGTLYVGKAKNLKKRVGSYFSRSLNTKNMHLIARTADIEVTVTASEAEALLLENNLIKAHMPRYNILLRDDKSYPYMRLSDEEFPRLSFYRGSRKLPGLYFGPYTSVKAVRQTMDLMFGAFRLRQCTSSMFHNRRRPCLQFQIKRCCAPCVGYVTKREYADRVAMAGDVLNGKCDAVVDKLVERMERAAEAQDYEAAAMHRDQVGRLRGMLQEQHVVGPQKRDADVLACCVEGRLACVQIVKIRNGLNIGNEVFSPKLPRAGDATIAEAEVLESFIGQYYLEHAAPKEIIVGVKLEGAELLATMLADKAGRRVRVLHVVRGHRRKWLESAGRNAQAALQRSLLSRRNMHAQLEALRETLGLAAPPQRMECFDVSHTMGEATVASCVVFNEEGADKRNYRRFNITGITGGDDYAALRQALERHFRRALKGGVLPDVLLIDGGKGQVGVAHKCMREFGVRGVKLVGVAKGPERRAGEETLVVAGDDGKTTLKRGGDVAALHLIQRIRDEAHRFAIMGHRRGRAKRRGESVLEAVRGLGPRRRRSLLTSLGGLHGVKNASVDELARVNGISPNLARLVYDAVHDRGGGE